MTAPKKKTRTVTMGCGAVVTFDGRELKYSGRVFSAPLSIWKLLFKRLRKEWRPNCTGITLVHQKLHCSPPYSSFLVVGDHARFKNTQAQIDRLCKIVLEWK